MKLVQPLSSHKRHRLPSLLVAAITVGCCRGGQETCAVENNGDDRVFLPGDESISVPTELLPLADEGGYVDAGYGEVQGVAQGEAVRQRLSDMVKYMQTLAPEVLALDCTMRHESCAFWASVGECEARPGTYRCFVSLIVCGVLLRNP